MKDYILKSGNLGTGADLNDVIETGRALAKAMKRPCRVYKNDNPAFLAVLQKKTCIAWIDIDGSFNAQGKVYDRRGFYDFLANSGPLMLLLESKYSVTRAYLGDVIDVGIDMVRETKKPCFIFADDPITFPSAEPEIVFARIETDGKIYVGDKFYEDTEFSDLLKKEENERERKLHFKKK